MSVKPIIPGHAYHVRGMGLDFTALATNPVDAMCMAIDLLISQNPNA
jgi:hypothetical protein